MEKTNCLLDAVKNQLQNAISNIDAGNSNLNEEEMEELVKTLSVLNKGVKRISKAYACEHILHCSPATFDNYVRAGIIPKGKKEIGFNRITNNNIYIMSSINQLVSEIAHIAQAPNNVPLRRSIRQEIIHYRNELIRKSYNNHSISDKVLQQKFVATLIDIPDGDIEEAKDLKLPLIKRTSQKVPRPTRLPINLPFHSVRTLGSVNVYEIPFTKEASVRFNKYLPGMCNTIAYDYINEYIYIYINPNTEFSGINKIVIESIFEYPHIIETETVDGKIDINDPFIDDNEFLLPEDLIGPIKDMVLQRLHLEIPREDNTISVPNKLNG